MTINACAAGKDVNCEKLPGLTIAEERAMVDAARKHKRIVQTGSRQRSDDRNRLACELSAAVARARSRRSRSTCRGSTSPVQRFRTPRLRRSRTMTSGWARRRAGRTTRSTSTTISGSFGTAPVAG